MTSRLLADLPALYGEDPFLGRFLLGFETLLLGLEDGVAIPDPGVPARALGLEQLIAGLAAYFDPARTPAEFLPWLASWVALSFRADMPENRRREFLASVAQRYRRRGTKGNLEELIATFTQGKPTITEDAAPFRFTVVVRLPPLGAFSGKPAEYAAFIDRQTAITHALIEAEKPAYTTYTLQPIFPSLQIGVHSTVGVDTLLGTAVQEGMA